jgi:hypothetical protein
VLHEVEPSSKGLQDTPHLESGRKTSRLGLGTERKSDEAPLEVRISTSDMEKALNKAGFTVTKRLFPAEFLYVFVAAKSAL